jgi:DMSO reductase anchor subunit
MAAAVGHLGRPWLAYRAILGWRTSWLSREILAFGLFALLASLYAASPWLPTNHLQLGQWWNRALGGAVALSGVIGVACSVMIYASTRRAFWNPLTTGMKFLLSCLILGLPVALLMQVSAAARISPDTAGLAAPPTWVALSTGLLAASGLKLLVDASIFCWLRARTFTPLRRTALLMVGDLRRATAARFAAGIIGGLALPGLLLFVVAPSRANQPASLTTLALAALILALCLLGEVLERYLFFVAAVAPKMPGAPAT